MSYQNSEEAKDVDDQYHTFNQWKLFGEERIEEDGNSCHGDDH